MYCLIKILKEVKNQVDVKIFLQLLITYESMLLWWKIDFILLSIVVFAIT